MVIDDFKNLAEEFDGSKVCPCCRADVEEVEGCDCGNWMSKGETFCEECKIDLRKQFHLLFQDLKGRRSSLQFPFLQADDHRIPKHILYPVQRVQKV
jgi:hypothetical protein